MTHLEEIAQLHTRRDWSKQIITIVLVICSGSTGQEALSGQHPQ